MLDVGCWMFPVFIQKDLIGSQQHLARFGRAGLPVRAAAARRAWAWSMSLRAWAAALSGGAGAGGENLRWSHWRRKSLSAAASSGPICAWPAIARQNSAVVSSPGGELEGGSHVMAQDLGNPAQQRAVFRLLAQGFQRLAGRHLPAALPPAAWAGKRSQTATQISHQQEHGEEHNPYSHIAPKSWAVIRHEADEGEGWRRGKRSWWRRSTGGK